MAEDGIGGEEEQSKKRHRNGHHHRQRNNVLSGRPDDLRKLRTNIVIELNPASRIFTEASESRGDRTSAASSTASTAVKSLFSRFCHGSLTLVPSVQSARSSLQKWQGRRDSNPHIRFWRP